ncbi:MAG: hypothetical protein COX57_03560 [Alphaproteobacteria bacterium CG_4_10_14_0_2_um_filter_63_37]|nr:MAG: hypothetical protein AUJ55_09950 [Proteobacteria bacterium CG1_02_64_396]PJA25408.1 MAG: hypothetical protein COX57_03560 [Alphaproteobacteria bacterium CG_4_10_14_0_2_um_filter_63_37]
MTTPLLSRRVRREQRTIALMIGLYCRDHHATPRHDQPLCVDCQALHDYAMERIRRCPLLPGKPQCSKCPVHCYKPAMKERVRAAMRYAGPRMLARHPWLVLMHWIEGRRRVELSEKTGRGG